MTFVAMSIDGVMQRT